MYKAWKARRDKYPDGGPIRTYRPETSQLRGYLTAAMAKSKIPKVHHYNHSLLLPENALKSYDEIYKALRVIGEDCAKDAISRAIANCRDKNANQSSGGSGAKAVNSLTSTGSKRGQGSSNSGPAAGIKCKNCGDNHYICHSLSITDLLRLPPAGKEIRLPRGPPKALSERARQIEEGPSKPRGRKRG